MKKSNNTKHHFLKAAKAFFWFAAGICLGLFFSISFALIIFERIYGNVIYPGVYVDNTHMGGKTQQEVAAYFLNKNNDIAQTKFQFVYNDQTITVTAQDLSLGYNADLLAQQAYDTGRSSYIFSNILLVSQAYMNNLFLSPSFTYNKDALITALSSIASKVDIQPTDAVFTFTNGKVTTFQTSSDGQEIDIDAIDTIIINKIPSLVESGKPETIVIPIPIKKLKPKVSTGDANHLGIQELIGTGTSLFQHSAQSRIFNVTLAASRLNGVLIAPNEEFSFDNALGDVSKFTGYQQAYVIQNGKTVLGDGGGVCQVSTTMFRAALNAGLPITERHGHAYRVGYYEEDSPPGIDATVYVPTVDLKFKNDTGHYILIQTVVDPNILRLTFYLYGTSDGREVSMTTPIVTNETPAPPPLYTDDPTLPQGVIQQTDFAAAGAHVSFSRTVTKNGKVLDADTFVTDYQPWQAQYLRGTKE